MKKTTVMACFSIYGGTLEPVEVTDMLLIEPTEIKFKGFISSEGKRPNIETSWTIKTNEAVSYDINIQLNQLVEKLKGKGELLSEIRKKFSCQIVLEFVIKIANGETPGMHFSSEALSFFNNIGAEVDVDLYVYS